MKNVVVALFILARIIVTWGQRTSNMISRSRRSGRDPSPMAVGRFAGGFGREAEVGDEVLHFFERQRGVKGLLEETT